MWVTNYVNRLFFFLDKTTRRKEEDVKEKKGRKKWDDCENLNPFFYC
jgi:hypothetical protein